MAGRDTDDYLLTRKGPERYVVMAKDIAVSRKLYIGAMEEHAKVGRAIEVLRAVKGTGKIELLIDVGANLGHICIPIVKRGMAERAIAFEPDADNFRICSANILINDLARHIVLHNTALGSRMDESLQFELSEDNFGDHRVRVSDADGFYAEASREVITTRSTTLDYFFPELPSPRNTLVWMDVQGYEGHVLSGARKLLAQKTPMGFEFWPYGLSRANSFECLIRSLEPYGEYYDLGCDAPSPLPVSELRGIYEERRTSQYQTDILVV